MATLSLIEQIRNGSLWDFHGGIHPKENKSQSNQSALINAALPDELVLPLKQHIGAVGKLLVKVNDHVLKGQALTFAAPINSEAGNDNEMNKPLTVPIHAPTSGEIVAIEPRVVPHPSGLSELSIIIKPDGEDRWCNRTPNPNFTESSAQTLLNTIHQAGIVGMGGAGFPTAKKIQSGLGRTEILIVNAAECEPYITADDRLIREYANDIVVGIDIVEHIIKPKLVVIAIEDNKPEAIQALVAATSARHEWVIRVIPTKYPSGSEKQLIKIITNQEVPSNSRPADIGILMQNIGSLYAIKRAVVDGEPLIERVVTFTGKTLFQPRNLWVRIGTPIQAVLTQLSGDNKSEHSQSDTDLAITDPTTTAQAGIEPASTAPVNTTLANGSEPPSLLIIGGPMMGFTLPNASVPIIKTSNCILVPTAEELPIAEDESPCIRCGQCAQVCPSALLPQQLLWHAKAKEYDKCTALNLKDCIECGACAYVCPSMIPLVQYYRQSKAALRAEQLQTQAAERAKIRFETRQARLEQEKLQRAERIKLATQRQNSQPQNGQHIAGTDANPLIKSERNDELIAAAIARVAAQKSALKPESIPQANPAVAAAIARAKAKQAALKNSAEESTDTELTPTASAPTTSTPAAKVTNPAVAAAIARAKAKQAALKNSTEESTDTELTPTASAPTTSAPTAKVTNPAVAAAIARAKAKQAALKNSAEESTDTELTPTTSAPTTSAPAAKVTNPAVAAAIARAKAKQAALKSATPTSSPTAEPPQLASGNSAINSKLEPDNSEVIRLRAARKQQIREQKALQEQQTIETENNLNKDKL